MVSGNGLARYFALIGPLSYSQILFARRDNVLYIIGTHPGIYKARCLCLDYALDEFDTAYADAGRRIVNSAEDVRLDAKHFGPRLVIRIFDSVDTHHT
jgi:hypothetical protein